MKFAPLFPMLLTMSLLQTGFAQIRTEETRKTVDPALGDTVVTHSIIVSTSEDITPRTGVIIVNPLKFFLFYNLSYVHQLSPGIALGGGFQIPTVSGVNGWGVNAELRVYPSGKSPRGFYVAPNIAYNHLYAGKSEANPLATGILLGWQWFPGDEFAIGLGIGIDYYSGSALGDDREITNFNGTVPALRFDIGYAW
jgi:hypothetical protein